jgi:hypothetical protein
MNKLELSPDGHERIEEKIQAVADAVNRGIFKPELAAQSLREAGRCLCELRQTLGEVCLLTPGAALSPGPGGGAA